MNKNISTKVTKAVTGLMAAVMVFGGGSVAYAASGNMDTAGNAPPSISAQRSDSAQRPEQNGPGMEMNMDFSSLVTGGVINQATADRLTAYQQQKETERTGEMQSGTKPERPSLSDGEPMTGRLDLFADAVSAGIITQAQADAIMAAMPAPAAREPMK